MPATASRSPNGPFPGMSSISKARVVTVIVGLLLLTGCSVPQSAQQVTTASGNLPSPGASQTQAPTGQEIVARQISGYKCPSGSDVSDDTGGSYKFAGVFDTEHQQGNLPTQGTVAPDGWVSCSYFQSKPMVNLSIAFLNESASYAASSWDSAEAGAERNGGSWNSTQRLQTIRFMDGSSPECSANIFAAPTGGFSIQVNAILDVSSSLPACPNLDALALRAYSESP